MAERIELAQCAVGAGVLSSAPTTFPMTFDEGVVRKLEILIPPGPSGLVGFRVAHSSQVVIPFRATQWVIADDAQLSWDLEGYPTGNKWAVIAYNTDIYPHTIYLRWFLDEIATVPAGPMQPVSIT